MRFLANFLLIYGFVILMGIAVNLKEFKQDNKNEEREQNRGCGLV